MKKIIKLIAIGVGAALSAHAQQTNLSGSVPAVTGIRPASAAAGVNVTLIGTNFSPNAASNIVYFGAVRAKVVSANVTNLTVTVPIGSTFAPITVTVNSLTASSPAFFLPAFVGSGMLNSGSLSSPINLTAGDGPARVVIGDLDGDGKPDVVVANVYDGSVWIYRNTSTNGQLSTASFASPVVLPIGGGRDSLYGLALADLDGDGRLDIVTANRNLNIVSIFQNLSLPGSLTTNSFGARVDLPTAGVPRSVAIMDLDGDGRPEIVSANEASNTVSVFRNLGISGLITTNSFASPVNFGTGAGINWVVIADIDGDSKPDVVTGNSSSDSSVSILRNTSSLGNISFANAIGFEGIGGIASIAVGDLDGDGKLDIVYSSMQGQAVSVYRNISTPGNITTNSLAPHVDFGTSGWANMVAIGDLDGDGKPDLIVTTQLPDNLSIFKNISTSGSLTTNSFGSRIDFASGYNPNGIAIGDLVGDGRPDIAIGITYGSTLSLYQNTSTFAIPPVIITQPTNQTVLAGGTTTFTVTTGGSFPQTYQWNYNSTNLVGATNTTLVLSNVQLAQAGNYSVQISNTLGATNSATAVLTVMPASVPSPSGMVAWWRAEGNANDSIGNNNGFPVGNLGYTNGEVGQAFVFDGSTSYIPLPASASLNVGTNGGFTIECWIKPNYSEGAAMPITEWDSSSTAGLTFWAESGHKIYLAIIDTQGNNHAIASTNDLLNTNSWQHVALTYDKASGNAAIYYNGTITTNLNLGSFTPQTVYPMNIGRRTATITGQGSTFHGLMDELSLYNRALSSNEIAAIYNSGSAGKTPPPPTIVTQPVSQTNLFGTLASFSVVAGGTQPLTYQWIFNGTNIANATNATLTLSNAQLSNAGNYAVFISNPYGSTNSASVSLTVTSPILAALVPVITRITPASAVAGTSIVIAGTNFSSNAASNLVYFGTVRANVASASATNLTVITPIGATFAPITVTVNNLTAYSPAPFLPTFAGSGTLFPNSFSGPLNLAGGSGPALVAIGDLDGDGKPDVVVANVYDGSVWIYRNISTNGPLTTNSFAPPVIFTIGGGTDSTWGLALADLDGDGRLDIVVANRNFNIVSIFQNLSSPGSLTTNSFAARVDLPVAGAPSGVAVMDLDGDGRPEIVTADTSINQVSVLKNLGTSGLITTNSFAPPVNFATGPSPFGLAIADIDGDGKSDLITGNTGSSESTLSILRNTSALGNIAFANEVDFAGLGGGKSVAVGDLDGDGKLDVVYAAETGLALSVYRNTSTPGSITTNSLAPHVDLVTSGWANTVAIGDMDGDGKPDLIVTTQLPDNLSIFKNISTSGTLTASSFGARIDFASGWNPNGIAIGDLVGDGRPDVAFGISYGATLSIYQNVSAFASPPVITTQPTNQTVLAGGTATFTVTAGGSFPQTYQWSCNSTNVVGATNATLILADVQLAQAGNYAVQISNTLGATNSASATLTVVLPPVITTQPQSQSVLSFQSAGFMVAATGTGPINFQWRKNGTNLSDGGNISGSLTTNLNLAAVTLADAGNYDVVVSSPYATTNSAVAILTVPQTALSIGSASAMSGTTLTVPITMNALGVENTFLASVGYDTSKLVLQSVQLGQATAGAYLQEVDTQTNNGLVGFAILLNNGAVVPAGTQQVAQIVFNTLPVTNSVTTSLTFGDTPTSRQVLDNNFDVLPATYLGGTISLTPAEYEADVYPRTNGDHQVSVQDWLEVGRMVAGLDVVTNSDEMLRADCAPRNAPDGILTVADWVQAGRYALGLDPLTLVPPPLVSQQKVTFHGSPAPTRTVELATVSAQRGQTVSVPVLLISSTNENAVGLTVTYNSSQLKYLSTALGSALSSGRLNINTNPAAGKVGLALALSPGASLAAGTNQIAVLQFQTATNAVGNLPLILDSSVVQLQVADKTAVALTANYVNGAVSLPPAPTVQTLKVGNNLTLAWPISAGSYVVQSANSPTGPWSNAPQNINTNGINANVTVQATNQQQFFRLLGQ